MNYDNSNGSEFLDQVTNLLSRNLDNDEFGVSQMAREMAMSRSSLHRRLKQVTGVTTSEFMRNCRLDRAKVLLRNSSATISEIAYACGFNSLAYFDTCFKGYFGYTPGEYRELIQVEESNFRLSRGFENWSHQPHELEPVNDLHNFPVSLTSFIGRSEELEAIQQLLREYRIVTLTGPGGCGKTRLATEVVYRLSQRFKDGVWFVDLSSVNNNKDDFVVKQIMKALAIPEGPGEQMLDTLIDRLKPLELLIILDNCEHLADVAGFITAKLSKNVPGLKILITSRKVLNIIGEKVWRIPPLSLVQPEKVIQVAHAEKSEAVLLFTERASLADQNFKLDDKNCHDVASLCCRLDGIPLAIELVASRIRYMEPVTLLEKLGDQGHYFTAQDPQVVDRHRTVNQTIDWSYNLLLGEQKELITRLCIFSGGFDLKAAEVICSDKGLPAKYVQDLLASLVDCSMVNTTRVPGQSIRYYMLETIRQYVTVLNGEKDLKRLSKKHLDYFFNMAEAAYWQRMSNQAFWMEKLGLDYENLMLALNWAKSSNRLKYRALAGLLGWWWTRGGYHKLAADLLGEIIEEGKAKSSTRARVLAAYSWAISGDINRFGELYVNGMKAAAIWHRLKNKSEEAIVLTDMALLKLAINENHAGHKLAQNALDLANDTGEPGVLVYVLGSLSQALVNLKKCDEVQSVIREILELADSLDNNMGRFAAYHNSGDCAAMQGQFETARTNYAEGLRSCLRMGDMLYTITELMGLAIAESGLGNYAKCLRLAGASNAIAKKVGLPSRELSPMLFWQELIQKHIHGAREQVGKDLQLKYETEGDNMEFEEAVAYALDFGKE